MSKLRIIILTVAFIISHSWAMDDDVDDDSEDDFYDMDLEDTALRYRIDYIFPGTKWCGAGNKATNYDDLGSARETDMCCREHDNCPDIIEAGGTKHGLNNTASYTRLHCDCDNKFYDCLKAANKEKTSKIIGKIYFNTLNTKCYRLDYPVTGCADKSGWIVRQCKEYTYDYDGEKKFQWFDVKVF